MFNKILFVFILASLYTMVFCSKLTASEFNVASTLKNLETKYVNDGYLSSLHAASEYISKYSNKNEKAALYEFCVNISYKNNDFDTALKFIEEFEKYAGSLNNNVAQKKLAILISQNKNIQYEPLIDYIFDNLSNDFGKFNELTNILFQYGMLDKIIVLYNKAKIKFNNQSVFLPILINIFEAQERFDSAVIEYKNFLFSNPMHPLYFENFKKIIYSKKMFSAFLFSLNDTELAKFSEISNYMPLLADAYFHTGNIDNAEKMYFNYFKSVKYDPQIIENIISKLAEAGQKSLSVKLLFGIIRFNNNFTESSPYKNNLFKLNISENNFFLFLLADNLDIINYDSEIIKLLASSLSSFQNDYFNKIIVLLPQNNFKNELYFKYSFFSGDYDTAAEFVKKLDINNSELSYLAGLANLYAGKFETAKLYFEKVVLSYGDSKYVPDSLIFYKFLNSNLSKKNYDLFLSVSDKKNLTINEYIEMISLISDETMKSLCYIVLMKKNVNGVFDLEIENIIPNKIFMPEALFLKADYLLLKNNIKESKNYLEQIITGYSDSLYYSAAKKMLKEKIKLN